MFREKKNLRKGVKFQKEKGKKSSSLLKRLFTCKRKSLSEFRRKDFFQARPVKSEFRSHGLKNIALKCSIKMLDVLFSTYFMAEEQYIKWRFISAPGMSVLGRDPKHIRAPEARAKRQFSGARP